MMSITSFFYQILNLIGLLIKWFLIKNEWDNSIVYKSVSVIWINEVNEMY